MINLTKRDRNQRERIIQMKFIVVWQPVPTSTTLYKKHLIFFHGFYYLPFIGGKEIFKHEG